MAIGDINPGYMGYATIAGTDTRFSDANIAVKQEVNAPDLIMGHYNRMAYVYGPAQVDGSISGPITESFASGGAGAIFDWAVDRGTCGELTANDLTLYYYCDSTTGGSRTFPDMYANGLTISATAGDIAQFSVDVIGAGDPNPPTWGGGSGGISGLAEEKLLTWDALQLTAGGVNAPDSDFYSSFEFSISNNVEPVYAIHSAANYYPFDLIPGLRTITASLSAYNVPTTSSGADGYSDASNAANAYGTLQFLIGSATVNLKGKFHRVEPVSSVGPIISTVAFTAVGPDAIVIT